MSKLQEIKQALLDRKERPALNHRHLNEWSVFSDMEWLIEQLEQAQAANQKLVEALTTIRDYRQGDVLHKIVKFSDVAREALSEVKGNGSTE